MPTTIDDLVYRARSRLARLGPAEASAAQAAGALLVDIRSTELRRRDGGIPGALVVDRNVLEWRLDPTSSHRIPEIDGYDQTIVLICNEGYASSLAAATLHELGLVNATDLDGGFQAWAASGHPVMTVR